MRLLRLILVLSAAVAQLGAHHPFFRIFTTQDGLVRNWVVKIHRDSKGFLWFCTVEGISLFDGYRFTNFSTRDGLTSRLVHDMVETRRGDFWFATGNGLARLHRAGEPGPVFKTFAVGATSQSNDIHALLEGPGGIVWCATGDGLYSFDSAARDPHPAPTSLNVPGPVEVLQLAQDSRRNLWVGTSQGVFRRRPGGSIESQKLPPMPGGVRALLVDGKDRLWIGGWRLLGLDIRKEPPELLAPEFALEPLAMVMALQNGDPGEIWIGTTRGLVRFHPDASPPMVTVYPVSEAFPMDHVGAIEQDVRHNLWLAPGSLGVVRVERDSIEQYTKEDGLDSAEVLGMVEGYRGKLYAVTGQWTLNELSDQRFVPIPLRVPAPLSTWGVGSVLVQDRDGAWWAASGFGVARFGPADARQLKGKAPARVYSIRDGLPDRTILRIFQDSRGDIWAGTTDGVGYWNRAIGRWQAFRTTVLLPAAAGPAAVHAFAEDRAGAVWAGMYPGGLVRFDKRGFTVISHDVPPGAINALLADREGRLWIGSSQGGVGRMDNPAAEAPEIRRYSVPEGLSSEHVFSLAEGPEGRIYVAGGRGVDRLDPDAPGVRHFTLSNGLPPGETQYLYSDREGSIWFASFYGLSRYRPEPGEPLETPAPLLRAVRIAGNPYPISEAGEFAISGIDLAPNRNSLEIEFRALNFDTKEDLRYQYRLEGVDTEWSKPSEAQIVRYASLPAGRYTFQVRGISESGKISSGLATLAFRIQPVFWKRSWFVGLLIFSVVSVTISFHRYRLHHVLAVERVRTQLATDLHDDLGSGLAEIAILSEVARRQELPRAIELLDGIAGRARSLRETMTDIVWSVDPREDCLADLVRRLRQVAFTMLESEERKVEFLAPCEEQLKGEVAPAIRRHLLLFFKEAMTNIARHASATWIRVEIEAGKGHFRITIRDNGRGFDPEGTHGGRGLKSLRQRAGELHGALRIESGPAKGTEVDLRLFLASRANRPR